MGISAFPSRLRPAGMLFCFVAGSFISGVCLAASEKNVSGPPKTPEAAPGCEAECIDSSNSADSLNTRVNQLEKSDSTALAPEDFFEKQFPPDTTENEDTTARLKTEPEDSLSADTSLYAPEPRKISFNPKALCYNGIYLNSWTAANSRRIDELITKSKGTPIGGFVIDMKDDHGFLSYTSKVPLAARIGANTKRIKDPAALVRRLHENGLVASARVVTFKDPILASYSADSTFPYAVLDSATGLPWEQDNGERWANPYDPRVHDYLLELIEELLEFGFDQIQLDYLRFPSDGEVSRCLYPVVIDSLHKADVIGLFLKKLRERIDTTEASLAVDVFGWVPWLQKDRNYWIGQDYDIIAKYADVICPMFYSSHFPESFKADYGPRRAYHIVREGTAKAVERMGQRLTGVQPYIQGFKWRAPYFGSGYLIDQILAAEESAAVGWLVWNAKNDYSALWKALDQLSAFTECKLD